MNRIRRIAAVWTCKLLIKIGKLAGKKGSSTPGIYALKIYPGILEDLSKQVKHEIIAVCGTNGKTTTNNLICSILEKKGYKVVCNKVGANMLPGVVTAFIDSADLFGNLHADYAAIEMDEASCVRIFPHFTPDIMVISNLFRDQLDRYGEIDITVDFLKKALALTKNTTLIINGDDPICATIGKDFNQKVITYGISEDLQIHLNETKEGQFCAYCGSRLTYDYYHYSQLGQYHCESCGFQRPVIDYEATQVDIQNGLKFTVNQKMRIAVDYRGFYNVYNILAALCTADCLHIDLSDINEILSDYKPQIGRMEKFDLGKPVILNLSKNPAGFNQGIFTVLSDTHTKDIIVMINDNAQDGKDISWIWDVDFEKLDNEKVHSLGFCGIRRYDVNVRFKYADFERKSSKVYDDLKSAIKDMIKKDGEALYILVNYTAIFQAQDILKELEEEYRKGGLEI